MLKLSIDLETLHHSFRHREVNILCLGLIQSGKLRLDMTQSPRTENVTENLSEVPDKPIYDKVNGGVDEL